MWRLNVTWGQTICWLFFSFFFHSHSPPSVASVEIGELLRKWPCRLCTFANWPRSTRCTMCQAPKSVSQPATAAVASSEQQQQQPGTNTPTPPPLLPGGTAGQAGSGRLSPRTRDVDRLWLEACRDVVRGEVSVEVWIKFLCSRTEMCELQKEN